MDILLKEFVEETINEVIEGIVNSQKNMLAKYNNPEDPNISISAPAHQKLDFDVLVASNNNSTAEGKGGLAIKVIDIGGRTTKTTEEKGENRIKFSVLFSVSDVNNFPSSH